MPERRQVARIGSSSLRRSGRGVAAQTAASTHRRARRRGEIGEAPIGEPSRGRRVGTAFARRPLSWPAARLAHRRCSCGRPSAGLPPLLHLSSGTHPSSRSTDQPITNYHGHPKSYYCDHFAESEGFLLETCMYFPFTTAKSLTGFGADHARMMSAMDRLQMILVLAIDSPDAETSRDGCDARDDRSCATTLPRACAGRWCRPCALRAPLLRRRRRARHAPAARQFFIEATEAPRIDELIPVEGLTPGKVTVSSAHPMGGCRMGAAPADSVTDSWGRVHGVPWLFVADGSLFALRDQPLRHHHGPRGPGGGTRAGGLAALAGSRVMTRRGSELVVRALEDAGARFAFGIPGTHNMASCTTRSAQSAGRSPPCSSPTSRAPGSWPTGCPARLIRSVS